MPGTVRERSSSVPDGAPGVAFTMIIITAALSHLQTRKRTRQRSARAQYASDCTRLCCDAPAAMGRAYNRAALVCCGSGAFSKARRKQSSAWICLSTVDAARMGACISVPMGRSGLPGLLQGRHARCPLSVPGPAARHCAAARHPAKPPRQPAWCIAAPTAVRPAAWV